MPTGNSPSRSRFWKDWVAALRLEYSVQRRSAHPTAENGCSSWQTPASQQFEAADLDRMLQRQAEQKAKGTSGNGFGLTLANEVKIWAREQAAAIWRTPTASDDGRKATAASHQVMLANQARLASFLLDRGIYLAGSRCLEDGPTSPPSVPEREMWPTPAASVVDIDTMERNTSAGYVRQAQKEAGSPYLARVSGVLNPAFVEWLMGWPIGWTDCASAATGFTRWRQDMRGLLSTLCSRRPRQERLL
jgi:hypothetical protein